MEWIWIEREEQNPTGGRGCVMGLDCERREEPYRRERMFPMRLWVVVVFIMLVSTVAAKPHRILLDTNVELDDVFAFLYRLKHNTLEFQLEVSEPK